MYETASREIDAAMAADVCDLRSDTVTRPSPAMRARMAEAAVGDDVYGEDPSVAALEAQSASVLGKAAAAFFPSGTQSNLAAVLAHCQRGEELLIGERQHVYVYEASGASVLGGIAMHALPMAADGAIEPGRVAAAVKPDDPHHPITRLLCLENTVGGQAVPLARMRGAVDAARAAGLAAHLDGARLFNAVAALEAEPEALAAPFDTISICLSKGLGAPAGSVLVGGAAEIARARRWRKMLGGGMRQAGVLAAAGRFALEENRARLAEDHRRAARLAAALCEIAPNDDGPSARSATNMAFFTPRQGEHDALQAHLAARGVLVLAQRPSMRLVAHLDLDDAKLDRAIAAFADFYRARR